MMTESANNPESRGAPELPCRAELLVAQRPPMLLAGELRRRDRDGNISVVSARVPLTGLFVTREGRLQPEYFIELIAQTMAAVNGYDALADRAGVRRDLLVGIDRFSWLGNSSGGEELRVEVVKTFEFGPVTVMKGQIFNQAGELLAEGEIKAWEVS
jgi:hypothetical protein